MLGSYYRFSSIDSGVHRLIEEFRQVPTKTPRANKVDNSLVDEIEHVLLLVDFCRLIDSSFSLVFFRIFQYLSTDNCFKHLFFHASSIRYRAQIVFQNSFCRQVSTRLLPFCR